MLIGAAAGICWVVGALVFLGLLGGFAETVMEEILLAILGIGFWTITAVLAAAERIRNSQIDQINSIRQLLMERDRYRDSMRQH